MRKMFEIYERELNSWLEQVLRRVTRVLDVGANDGYFTFGCAAAFGRLGKTGEIIAFEPRRAASRYAAREPGQAAQRNNKDKALANAGRRRGESRSYDP